MRGGPERRSRALLTCGQVLGIFMVCRPLKDAERDPHGHVDPRPHRGGEEVVRHRRREPGAGPGGHGDRAAPAGQAQAYLHAVPGRRRPRRHRQRREGEADGPEGRAEAVPLSQRVRGRVARRAGKGRAAASPHPHRRGGRARHAPQDEAGRRDVPQAEGVRGPRSIRTRRRNPPTTRSRNVAVIQYYGTGRRKKSTARVFLRPGHGRDQRELRPDREGLPHRDAARCRSSSRCW